MNLADKSDLVAQFSFWIAIVTLAVIYASFPVPEMGLPSVFFTIFNKVVCMFQQKQNKKPHQLYSIILAYFFFPQAFSGTIFPHP